MYQSNKECSDERASSIVNAMLSGGHPLEAGADSGRCCRMANPDSNEEDARIREAR